MMLTVASKVTNFFSVTYIYRFKSKNFCDAVIKSVWLK